MYETKTFANTNGSGDSDAMVVDNMSDKLAILRWTGGTSVSVKVSEDGATFDALYTRTVSPAFVEVPEPATHLKVTGTGGVTWVTAKLRAFNPATG